MTYKGIETIPVFHWGMYSANRPASNEYDRKAILVNGAELNLTNSKGITPGYLFSLLDYYKGLKENDFNDPIHQVIDHRFSNFPSLQTFATNRLVNNADVQILFRSWLCNYLQSRRAEKIESIKIVDQKLFWDGLRMQAAQAFVIDSFNCKP